MGVRAVNSQITVAGSHESRRGLKHGEVQQHGLGVLSPALTRAGAD